MCAYKIGCSEKWTEKKNAMVLKTKTCCRMLMYDYYDKNWIENFCLITDTEFSLLETLKIKYVM